MSVMMLDADRFGNDISNSDRVVLVDFFATWCGPCRMLSPVIEEIADEYDGEFDVYKCDIDENEDLAREFSVMSVPTLIIFKDGEEVDRLIGVRPKEEIVNSLKSA